MKIFSIREQCDSFHFQHMLVRSPNVCPSLVNGTRKIKRIVCLWWMNSNKANSPVKVMPICRTYIGNPTQNLKIVLGWIAYVFLYYFLPNVPQYSALTGFFTKVTLLRPSLLLHIQLEEFGSPTVFFFAYEYSSFRRKTNTVWLVRCSKNSRCRTTAQVIGWTPTRIPDWLPRSLRRDQRKPIRPMVVSV
jgi:hypothetical protein